MIRNARRLLRLVVALVLFVAAMAALALWRFVEDPVALVFEVRETASMPVPGSRDRLVVERSAGKLSGQVTRRILSFERMGQRVVSAQLLPGADPEAPVDVFFFPPFSDGSGPFLFLGEPGAEYLVDLRQAHPAAPVFPAEHLMPGVYRFVRTPLGPFLAPPGRPASVGAVVVDGFPPDVTHGRTAVSAGLFPLALAPGFRLPVDTDPGRYRIGRFEGGYGTGRPFAFVPVRGAAPLRFPVPVPFPTRDSGDD